MESVEGGSYQTVTLHISCQSCVAINIILAPIHHTPYTIQMLSHDSTRAVPYRLSYFGLGTASAAIC